MYRRLQIQVENFFINDLLLISWCSRSFAKTLPTYLVMFIYLLLCIFFSFAIVYIRLCVCTCVRFAAAAAADMFAIHTLKKIFFVLKWVFEFYHLRGSFFVLSKGFVIPIINNTFQFEKCSCMFTCLFEKNRRVAFGRKGHWHWHIYQQHYGNIWYKDKSLIFRSNMFLQNDLKKVLCASVNINHFLKTF